MKTVYNLRFFRDEFEKIKDAPKEWIDKKASNSMAMVIKIEQNHPNCENILNWTKKHKKTVIGQTIEVNKIYTKEELTAAEILYIPWLDWAPGEMYGEDYGTKYRTVTKFKQFEIKQQTTPLFCNTSKLSKKKDLQTLFSAEIIISKKLKEILEKEKLTGIDIKPVYRPTKIKDLGDVDEILSDKTKQSTDFFQLIVSANCENIVSPPTVFGEEYINLEHKANNAHIIEYNLISGIDWQSNLYLNKKKWPKTDFAITREKIMAEYPYPLLVITQRAYQILIQNGISGFEAEPAIFI